MRIGTHSPRPVGRRQSTHATNCIRCHPCAPVAAEELEAWLEAELERLRASAPQALLRLLRLSQQVPTGEAGIGWLIELDAASGERPLEGDDLAAVLRDMRLLGLQPTVLRAGENGDAPARGSDTQTNGTGA
jgi:hypothetical protein